MSADATGVIHDIGYQRYEGPRLGRAYAVRSLYTPRRAHRVRVRPVAARPRSFPWIIVGIMTMVAVDLHGDPVPDRRGRPVLLGVRRVAVDPRRALLRDRGPGAGLPGPARRGAAALLLPPTDQSGLCAGQAGRPDLGHLPGHRRPADAHVRRRRVHARRLSTGSGTSSAATPPGWPSRCCTRCVFGALSLLVASLAGRRAVAAALIVGVFLVTPPIYGLLVGIAFGRAASATPEGGPIELTGSNATLAQLAGLVSPVPVGLRSRPVVVRRHPARRRRSPRRRRARLPRAVRPVYFATAAGLFVVCVLLLLLRYRKVAR